MHLTDAILLFRRLGVDVHSLAAHEFTLAYFRFAKKYHPDRGNRDSHELMAGQRYRSLNVIAERITGAHWSGPRFFGLIKRARAF